MNAFPDGAELAALQAAGQADVPLPLPPDLPPVDAFPMQALPAAFAPWVADVAERMQCPPDFVAVPMLTAAASQVAQVVAIRPQQLTEWTERGNLWTLVVGRPGVMKSPAMAQALAPLQQLESEAAKAYNDALAEHQVKQLEAKLRYESNVNAAKAALKKDANADLATMLPMLAEAEPPVRRRLIVADSTYEKLGETLAANPGGVLLVRDEMKAFLSMLGREESATARGFYLQAWSGGSYTFDRIGRGTLTVPDARLSMIGAIQPGPLIDLMWQSRKGSANDGLIERFLVAWPDAGGAWREIDRAVNDAAKREVWDVFRRLAALTPAHLGAEVAIDPMGKAVDLSYLRFDAAAREAFSEWRGELERRIQSAGDEALEAALSKFRHHVPVLALAIHAVDGGTGPVALRATVRALALADYFESHTRRLYGSGPGSLAAAARKIVQRMRKGDLPQPFTARDVYRNQWSGLADREVVNEALDLLAAKGWLLEAVAETGGRPTILYTLAQGARHVEVA